MSANTVLISCNFTPVPSTRPKLKTQIQNLKSTNLTFLNMTTTLKFSDVLQPHNLKPFVFPIRKRFLLQKCQSILDSQNSKDPDLDDKESSELRSKEDVQKGRDWTTSILLFVLWGGLMYYVFNLAPNQTPVLIGLCFIFYGLYLIHFVYAVL